MHSCEVNIIRVPESLFTASMNLHDDAYNLDDDAYNMIFSCNSLHVCICLTAIRWLTDFIDDR